MSHVLNYRGQYFRVEIAEVANPDDTSRAMYVGWCSDAFQELQDMPTHACTRFIGGTPLRTQAEALRHAYDWIKRDWDTQLTKQTIRVGAPPSVLYTVWLFKRDTPFGFDFTDFSDAKAFASAAQTSMDVTKVGIKNNESPQFLTVWEKE